MVFGGFERVHSSHITPATTTEATPPKKNPTAVCLAWVLSASRLSAIHATPAIEAVSLAKIFVSLLHVKSESRESLRRTDDRGRAGE